MALEAGQNGAGQQQAAGARRSARRVAGRANEPVAAFLPPAAEARAVPHELRRPWGARANPADFSISLRNRFGSDQQLHRPGPRRQSMRGFEDHYADIVDYIIRATHRVWEEHDVGYIYDIYRHDCMIRGESGLGFGRDQVMESSLGLLAAFPDMRWLPREVIWAGDDEGGFHTSHRSIFVGTNTGWSQFGPPTGRRCTFMAIANCVATANEIHDEWVIENAASMIQQLGLDVRQVARRTADAIDLDRYAETGSGERVRLLGQGKPEHLPPPTGDGFDPEDFVRRMLHYVWNWRMVGMTRDTMSPGLRCYGAVGQAIVGLGDYQANILARLAMFPDLVHTVDDVYWMGNDVDGHVVAVRWTMIGTHRGNGIYGAPTGRRVQMWGISHFEIRQERIVEEWTLHNEFATLQQIHRTEPMPGGA